jgi:hypothetical protein
VVLEDPAVEVVVRVDVLVVSMAAIVVVEGNGSPSGQRAQTPIARPAIRRPTISHLTIEG